MKISYNWLQEYIDGELPPLDKVIEALTMHSFEIEGVEKVGDDSILDVKVLPNRSHDCLSHYGIASELVSVCGLSRKKLLETVRLEPTQKISKISVDSKLCARAVAVYISNIETRKSPEWLTSKLKIFGQRSINPVVDITNYLMYAFGQPTHAFDAQKLSQDKKGSHVLHVREAKKGEKITLLNGKSYELDPLMLVIADSEKALDVAGVMGGNDTGVSENTTEIILTLCNFDPVSIRKTSKALGIRTDASQRFENGISPLLIDRVLPYALALITEITGGIIEGGIDVYPKPQPQHIVQVAPQKISAILGVDLSSEKIIEILGRQAISAVEKNGLLEVQVPFERLDLTRAEDIAEEVGRLYGYENIPSQILPQAPLAETNLTHYVSDIIKSTLAQCGFSEIRTYAFVNDGEIEVENPIAGDKKFLRHNLSAAMTISLQHNFKFLDLLGLEDVKLFEIGTVFSYKKESIHLSLGAKLSKSKKVEVADIEIAKAIHAIEDALHVSIGDVSIVGGLAEIDLEKIVPHVNARESISLVYDTTRYMGYSPISPYPFAVRDIAVFVPSTVSADIVERLIREHLSPLVVRFSLFDTFTKTFPDGMQKTSYGFRLVFQSPEKTLTDEEINAVMNPIYETLKSQDGFEIR
jgi:phenylalanyl-tRNA synthetase beta chain